MDVPNQFVIPLGGVGGSLNAAGFFVDSLTLPTTEGPGIRFVNAPVLVADISVEDPVTHQSLILDGDFGMNFLVASTDLSLSNISAGAFDWAVFDQPNGLLGLQIPDAPAVFAVPVASGNNSVYAKRDADQIHADFWLNSTTPGQGAPTQQTLISASQDFAMAGGLGNDTLTVDFSNGNPLPAGGLDFNGGAGVNTLAVVGTSGNDTLTAGPAGITFANSTFGSIPITAANVQTLQFHGGSGGSDSINLVSGSYNLDADTPTGTPNVSVSVQSGANATFGTDQHLAGLTIIDGTAAVVSATRRTIDAAALSIQGHGKLDLGGNDLLTLTSVATIRGYLANGYAGGNWNGATANGIIVSSSAAGSGQTRTLAYATAGDNVVPFIPAGKTLVQYAIPGDADLSGTVDFNDFTSLQVGFGHPSNWSQGDFNYTGTVDFNDFTILQVNFGHTGTASSAASSSAKAGGSSMRADFANPAASASASSSTPAVAKTIVVSNVVPITAGSSQVHPPPVGRLAPTSIPTPQPKSKVIAPSIQTRLPSPGHRALRVGRSVLHPYPFVVIRPNKVKKP